MRAARSQPATFALKTGVNCWRIARADRVAVVVDAADYFEMIKTALAAAQHRIMLIGWDFDTRITLARDKNVLSESFPDELGKFILALAKSRPDLEIRILKWDLGALKLLGRGRSLFTAARWALQPNVTFKLDGAHPPGCSHHQKIVVIDDALAVCGGIDMTQSRWDTSEHQDDDPRRTNPDGKIYMPWHDVTMVVDGAAAKALGALGRARWERAGGATLAPVKRRVGDLWPTDLVPDFREVELGIARTSARWKTYRAIHEIERLFADQIASARHFVYAENQYFASRRVAEAIAKRLAEPDPPEIILVTAESADGWLEQIAMDSARTRLVRAIGEHDHAKRFHIYSPVTKLGQPIYVHAKLTIVDDVLLRVGSANMNNRSLGLDSECDLILDSARPANRGSDARIMQLRHRLLAEHCGLTIDAVAKALAADPDMHRMIERRKRGRRLRKIVLPDLKSGETFLADNAFLDPESPDDFFEPLSSPGLFARRGRLQPKP